MALVAAKGTHLCLQPVLALIVSARPLADYADTSSRRLAVVDPESGPDRLPFQPASLCGQAICTILL